MRIAILAPHGGVALRPELPGVVGGAELQLKALAGILGELDHDVDYVVEGDQQDHLSHELGKIWPLLPAGGVPILKLVYPKGSRLSGYLRKRRPGLVIQRGASVMTALGATCAARRNIPFLFLAASDTDLIPGREILPHPQDRILYRTSLRAVSRVLVQTRQQQRLLWRYYGLRGRIFPSIPTGDEIDPLPRPQRGPVLWGGNFRPVKRLEWLIAMARRFPEIPFLVFGGPVPSMRAYGEKLVAEMDSVPNIDYRGPVSPDEVPSLVAGASLVLNSSEAEGFPNTFLEAWRQERPVLATVDPDALLSEAGLGYFAASQADLAGLLPGIWEGEPLDLPEKLRRGKEFLRENHSREAVASLWKDLIREIVSY